MFENTHLDLIPTVMKTKQNKTKYTFGFKNTRKQKKGDIWPSEIFVIVTQIDFSSFFF